jgi:hypothetical protein
MYSTARWMAAALVCSAGLILARPVWAQQSQAKLREVTDADIDRAIERTVRYIYGRQLAHGLWPDDGQFGLPSGGTSALALFALLDAGEKPQVAAIQKGLLAVCDVNTNNLYVRAFRLMALAQGGGREKPDAKLKGSNKPEDKATYAAQEKLNKTYLADKDYLMTNTATGVKATAVGSWGYTGPDAKGDNSCSQIALLALWELLHAGEDIPPILAQKIEATWIARQKKASNAWTYAAVGEGEPMATMTTAGIASMFICQDVLIGGVCKPYANQKFIDNAVSWVGPQLKPDFIKNGYLAFCVQRVGMAAGYKFIGDMDWFATGARELVKPQPMGPNFGGQWGPNVAASFNLLFLSRGRTPQVFNKVQLADGTGWDTHPRDIAQFALYMRMKFEERMRWQIVKLSDDLRLLLDAPILLVTAKGPLQLTDADWAKLREYSLRGGTLLFMPIHNDAKFVDAVKPALEKLYAAQREQSPKEYAMVQVPLDDPLYSAWSPMPNGDKSIGFLGISDGTRWLALISPVDMACTWQKVGKGAIQDHYTAAVNLYHYATGFNTGREGGLGSKMRPVFVGSDEPAKESIKVGWVRHAGNWNTQPYALDYLSQKLSAENRLSLDVTAGVQPGEDDLSKFKLLWITGVDDCGFGNMEVAALRKYLDGNGTIFLNAVGGAEKFAASADKLITQLGQGRTGRRVAPTIEHPVMSGKAGDKYRGLPLDDLRRTHRWSVATRNPLPPIEAWTEGDADGNYLRIIFARNGVHDTIDGHTSWRGMSYMPGSAAQLAANIVLYATMDRPAPPPPPAPATQPEGPATQPGTQP